MSALRRFRGAAVGALALAVAIAAWVASSSTSTGPDPGAQVVQEPIFRFEKEDLVGFDIVRPDGTLSLRQVDGRWRVEGRPWRPSASMVRKVAHQLHDLTARAAVVDHPEDYARYGLGEGAIQVTLHLADGRRLGFEVGDPNPTSVSWYVRPIPGDRVFVVKKSALDYYHLAAEEYREDRIATFDASEADTLEASSPDRELAFTRTGEHTWSQSAPVSQPASRDEVRKMLGRISALRALTFVEDGPADLTRYGLEPPTARLVVGLSGGDRVSLLVGDAIPGTEPPQRYVLREEDDAVYAVRDGFLEPFQQPLPAYRNLEILGRHAWDVRAVHVSRAGEDLPITRSAEDWRWADGQAIPGSTPERVAGRAADVRAVGFHDEPPPNAGFEPPWAVITLTFDDGTRTLTLGDSWEIEVDEPARALPPAPGGPAAAPAPTTRTVARQYLRVDGDPVTYEIEGDLAEVVEDLLREHARKVAREAERDLGVGG